MFKRNEIKLLAPFYLNSFFLSLTKVIMPFYMLYFLSIGFSFFQIAMIGSVRSVAMLLFEIPTGVIADIYGKKASVILGYLFTVFTIFCVPFTNNFYLILLIFALDAIFGTLISGADRAWVVNMLNENDKKLVDSYYLKTRFFKNAGMIIAPILGGILVSKYDMGYLWYFFGVGTLFSTVFLFFGISEKKSTYYKDESKENLFGLNFLNHIKESFGYIINQKIIMLLFLGVFLFYFIEEITGLAWTPFLNYNGIDLSKIGFIFSIISFIGIVIPILLSYILKKRSKIQILLTTILLYGLLLISLFFINNSLIFVVIFILFSSLQEIFIPLEDSLLNNFITGYNRATILSIKSMVEALSSIIGGPIAGVLLGLIDLKISLVLSGFLLLFISLIYNKIKNNGVDADPIGCDVKT